MTFAGAFICNRNWEHVCFPVPETGQFLLCSVLETHWTARPCLCYLLHIHHIKMNNSHHVVPQISSFLRFTTCSQTIWFPPTRTSWRRGNHHRGCLPLFLRNVIPSHCWPLLTPSPRDPPFPQRYANLCCALNRCPNNSLSGGRGGKPGLWQEKNAAIFMAVPHYHTAEDLYLGGGRGFRHTFPTIQISWVVKKKWWKGEEGLESGVSVGVKTLWLCLWALSEGSSSHTGSAVLVQTQYVLSRSRSRSTSLPQPSSL